MASRPLNILKLESPDPLERGHQHGETLREQIKEIAEIRLERTCALSPFKRVKDILALAEEHIPLLQDYDESLFLEFRGIAEASNISMALLVVLNHYTDLRDISPKSLDHDPGGCSIIFSPTVKGPILAQTWDIHGSAEPYVILLKFSDSILFSIAGCLGMTGLNNHGVAVAINNLSSIDAKVGVVWPALIRKALEVSKACDARDEILAAPLGSGRHFAIADEHDFFSIEASGTKKKLVWDNPTKLYFHTNHCLDSDMRKTHIVSKESTSYYRYQQLDDVIRHQDLSTAEKVFVALAGVGLPKDPLDPHKTATCGALVMNIKERFVLGCQGIPEEAILASTDTRISL